MQLKSPPNTRFSPPHSASHRFTSESGVEDDSQESDNDTEYDSRETESIVA